MVEPGTPKIRSSDQRAKRGRTISRACSTSASTVIALENAQQIGVKRLCAQTDAVHAGRGEDVGLLGVEGSGIGLDGPFAAGSEDQPALDQRASAGPASGASSRVGVPPPTKIVSTSWGSTRAALDLAFESSHDSGRPDDRRPPATRSRSNRTCVRRKGRARTPHAASASLARPLFW